VFAIDGVVRGYAWGSTTAIQAMLGAEPDGTRAAELWFGAHPDDPAPVPALATTLDRLIESDPAGLLGADTVERYGPRLPFLLKVLAADRPLSIQVHPTVEQAEAGFAAEDEAGVPRDSPTRNYRDRNHKPELLCALTVFTALCGFRPPADTVRLIDALPAPVGEALSGVRADLGGTDESAALRAAFVRLLTLPDDERTLLVDRVVSACRGILTEHAPLAAWADAAIGAARVVDLCAREFPGDIGAVLSLLLNAVVLQPGQAIYLGAGNVHAYLGGTGVEIMANSDNVLRCGLTPKHVDVPELLKLLKFEAGDPPRVNAEQRGPGWRAWPSRVDEFALSHVRVGGAHPEVLLPATGPRLLLPLTGRLIADDGTGPRTLTPGHAAFVPADRPDLHLTGFGELYQATTAG
jgi:mannose-6-phosphate isomerase